MSVNVENNFSLRRPLTRRTLSNLIASLRDDIKLAETETEKISEYLEQCARIARDVERTRELYAKSPEFLRVDKPDFCAAASQIDGITGRCETLIHAYECVIKVRRKTLTEAEKMLQQMPEF